MWRSSGRAARTCSVPRVWDGRGHLRQACDVSKRKGPDEAKTVDTLELSQLRRETRTALELGVVAMAPTELVDRLASAAGLLEALVELPRSSPPVVATVPRVLSRARSALD